MEYMAGLPDKAFDLAIVDPPFGIGKFWMKDTKTYKYGKETNWNAAIPSSEYFKELFRISSDQIIWGGNYFTEFLPPVNSWLIWDKVVPAAVKFSQATMAWTSLKTATRIKRIQWSGAICPGRAGIHPCEMPIALYRWQMKEFAKPGFKLFDSHGGSMSIAVAAHQMGYDLTVCEIDKKYFTAAKKRFKEQTQQQSIF